MVDVEALVPTAEVTAFLDEHVGASPTPVEVTKIGAGRSNLTFRVSRGDQRFVLRRPPRGELPQTAHDMVREHRVLSALADAEVRTPRPIAVEPTGELIGVPFYVMEEVAGIVLRDAVPPAYGAGERRRVGEEVIDALAELHTVDVAAVGLSDLGKPEGYTARQVRRWTGQWEVMATRQLDDIDAVRAWLAEHVPAGSPSGIVHGDYKLDNVVFSPEGPARLRAILDWEMATLGDPLADLGYLLVFWPEPGEPDVGGLPQPTREPGFASRRELIERYEAATGFAMTDLTFYRTLALWKLAILCEGLYKRYLAGKADSDWFEVLEHAVPAMARRARKWAEA